MMLHVLIVGSTSPWPAVVVAALMIGTVFGLTYFAMRESGMDGALKMMTALGPILGVLVGAGSGYFFVRESQEAMATEVQESSIRAAEQADVAARLNVELLQERLVSRTLEQNVDAKQRLIDSVAADSPQIIERKARDNPEAIIRPNIQQLRVPIEQIRINPTQLIGDQTPRGRPGTIDRDTARPARP